LPVHAAALASILLALVYIGSTGDDRLPAGTAPLAGSLDARPMHYVVEFQSAAVVPGRRMPAVQRVKMPARREPQLASEPAFGLTPMVTLDSMSLSELQVTTPLAPIEPAAVAPITLTELPLAIDAPSSSSKE
jgi:hypothetical protein